MAGILNRFTEIMSANINALLDKCEDPSKMIDQKLREAIKDLAEVKEQTKSVLADEKQAQRNYDAAMEDVSKEHKLAVNAMKAGDEEAASKFLASEKTLQQKADSYEVTLNAAKANSAKMREMYNKLATDIDTMKSRRNNIKATMSVAKATNKINEMRSPKDYGSKFDDYEQKAQRMLDEANAGVELDEEPKDELQELREKYSSSSSSVSSDELDALRKECGME